MKKQSNIFMENIYAKNIINNATAKNHKIMNLPKPKTNTQEILLTLIEDGSVSLFNFPTLSGFRTRVSELVNIHNLNLTSHYKSGANKFGNTYTYAEHILNTEHKQSAIDIYLKLCKNENNIN